MGPGGAGAGASVRIGTPISVKMSMRLGALFVKSCEKTLITALREAILMEASARCVGPAWAPILDRRIGIGYPLGVPSAHAASALSDCSIFPPLTDTLAQPLPPLRGAIDLFPLQDGPRRMFCLRDRTDPAA